MPSRLSRAAREKRGVAMAIENDALTRIVAGKAAGSQEEALERALRPERYCTFYCTFTVATIPSARCGAQL